jgi:FkbM family methyltransferase
MRYELSEKAELAIALLCEQGFIRALTTWPVFSVTSFLMISRLSRWGFRPRTVIDVGANVGQFAVSASMLFPEAAVYSYEPVPECFAKLAKAASKLNNMVAHPIALGDTDGELQFHVNSHSHSSSALALTQEHKKAFPFAQETKAITVPMRTLDGEYDSKELVSPVLLKLDVQGFEDRVLKGGTNTLTRVDYIVIEMSFKPMYLGENTFHPMLDLLDSLGFDFKQPIGFLNDPASGKYLQMDALFERRRT